jgi:transketolase
VPEDAVERGAYVLREASSGEPDAILIGTGTEVHLCNAAVDLLEEDGIATRLVSMPCVDRFAEQEEAYRDEVLPPVCRARVAVEAAAPLGWDRWGTDDGAVMGMTTFGASGPHKAVYEHFGFTPARVADMARETVARVARVDR